MQHYYKFENETITIIFEEIGTNYLKSSFNHQLDFYKEIPKKKTWLQKLKAKEVAWEDVDWQECYWEELLRPVPPFDDYYKNNVNIDCYTYFEKVDYNDFINIYSSLVSTPSSIFLIIFLLPIFLFVIFFICKFFSFRGK